MKKSIRERTGKQDVLLLILVLFLTAFGLVILYSVSSYNGSVRFHDAAYYLKKQLFATALGLGVMYAASRIDYHAMVALAPAVYLVSDPAEYSSSSGGEGNQWFKKMAGFRSFFLSAI